MWRGPQEYVTYEFVPTSPLVSFMSGSPNFDSFRGGWDMEGRVHPVTHLSIRHWLYTALQCRSSTSSNCLVFHTSGGISSSPAVFLLLIFSYNYLDCLMINFRGVGWGSESILKMMLPLVYSFMFAHSFQFSFGRALPSAQFVYRLPCYPRLSIFSRVSNLIDLILDVHCLFF